MWLFIIVADIADTADVIVFLFEIFFFYSNKWKFYFKSYKVWVLAKKLYY